MAYRLIAETKAHSKTARAVDVREQTICTGGLDGGISVLRMSDDGRLCVVATEPPLDPFKAKGIYSISFDGKTVVSGDASGSIWERSIDNLKIPVASYLGHSGPVSSLDLSHPSLLLSGSWDQTARVWSRETRRCILEMSEGLVYAVTAAFAGPDELILTGCQSGSLRLWKNGSVLQTIKSAHADIIRSISILKSPVMDKAPIFVTASNDGCVKLWTILPGAEQIIELPGSRWDVCDSFIFSAAGACAGPTDFVLVAGGDNGRCYYAKGTLDPTTGLTTYTHQENLLRHPGPVWGVKLLLLKDQRTPIFVTICEDGYVRCFNDSAELGMSLEESAQAQQAISDAIVAAEAAAGHVDLSKVPKAKDRMNYRGQPGKPKLFVADDNVTVEVYTFNGSSWDKVGDMVAPEDSAQYYEGDAVFPEGFYDYIFPVEIETRAGKQMRLPYNRSQEPMEVAEKFCAREQIGKINVPDIVAFIKQNAAGAGARTEPKASNPTPEGIANASSSPLDFVQPVTFEAASRWSAAESALLQLSDAQATGMGLTASQKASIHELIGLMEKPLFKSLSLTNSQLQALFNWDDQFSNWQPQSKLVPLFDFWRKLATNSGTYEWLRKRYGFKLYATMMRLIRTWDVPALEADNVNANYCLIRCVTNFLQWPPVWSQFVEQLQFMVETFEALSISREGNVQELTGSSRASVTALISLMHNLALGWQHHSRKNPTMTADQRTVYNSLRVRLHDVMVRVTLNISKSDSGPLGLTLTSMAILRRLQFHTGETISFNEVASQEILARSNQLALQPAASSAFQYLSSGK